VVRDLDSLSKLLQIQSLTLTYEKPLVGSVKPILCIPPIVRWNQNILVESVESTLCILHRFFDEN
jgi:hypothetical protein